MQASLRKIFAFFTKENRLLVFTLGFLLFFSVASYAFATYPATPYAPGDVTDPACAPGASNCYVDPYPDQSSHGGDFLSTDGSGNLSWTAGVTSSGTPASHDAAYWNSSGVVTGDSGFTWNPSTHELYVGDTDSSSDTSPHAQIDIDGAAGLGTITNNLGTEGIEYVNTYATDTPSVLQGLVIDMPTSTYSFGDIAGNKGLSINASSGTYTLGDTSSTGNYLQIASSGGGDNVVSVAVDQSYGTGVTQAKILNLSGGHGNYSLGDLSDYLNGTKLVLNDLNDDYILADSSGSGIQFLGTSDTSTATPIKGLSLDVKHNTYSLGNMSGNSLVLTDSPFSGTGTLPSVQAVDTLGDTNTYLNLNLTNSTFSVYHPKVVIGSVQYNPIGSPGLNDVSQFVTSFFHGPTTTFTVTITAVGTPDTMEFSDNHGHSEVDPAGGVISDPYGYGISLEWGSSTGHTLGDSWTFTDAVNESSGRTLSLDAGTGLYSIGDVDDTNNSTNIQIDDTSNHDVTVNGGLVINNSATVGGVCTIGLSGSDLICSSDERLKKNITDLGSELANIDQLHPVTFNWIDPKADQQTHIGFIAQEVQQVFPQFVASTGNGYLGVDYASLVTPAIKAIQELDLKVEPLTSIDPTVSGSLASLVTQYLENAVVTIKEATVNTLNIGGNVCADGVCVTQDQFRQMLIQAGGTSTTAASASTTTGTGSSGSTTGSTTTGTSTGGSGSPETGTSGSSSGTTTTGSGTTGGSGTSTADTTLPVITLLGSATVSLNQGDVYTDAGATATDAVDGNITNLIVTVNPVNTAVSGTYTVTYNVTDAAGNHAAQVIRTVIVSATAASSTSSGDSSSSSDSSTASTAASTTSSTTSTANGQSADSAGSTVSSSSDSSSSSGGSQSSGSAAVGQ